MKYTKIYLLIALSYLAPLLCSAQIDTLKSHLAKINAFYDSAQSMAFDVKFIYDSDTLIDNNYEHRENEGHFILDRNRFYYKLDFTECVQNDSFMITILEPEKLMMVGAPIQLRSGGLVPMRQQIDSLLAWDFLGYSYSINKTDSINKIAFTSTDSTAMYNKIAVYYDPGSFAILKYEIGFPYNPEDNEGEDVQALRTNSSGSPRQLTLEVLFANYRVANITEDLFDINKYMKTDGVGEWIGAGKYADYTINKLY